MSYSVNLGCWGSIFAVPTSVVDKYIKIAGSAQLKVLLWILRHSGESFELDTIAGALNMSSFDVSDCIEFWSSFDVIKKDGNVITPANTKPAPSAVVSVTKNTVEIKPTAQNEVSRASTVQKMPEVAVQADNKNIPKPLPQAEKKEQPSQKNETEKNISASAARPLRPDPVYVAKRISEDKEIEYLLNEAQYIIGRLISPNENAGIIMLHDNDGLPSEVILMLLAYGFSNGKGMRQIEAMGAGWAKDGVTTLQAAEEKIKQLEQKKEAWRKVQGILGLDFRKPTQKEDEIYTRWISEWKFSEAMIKEAYEICVNAKGKYIPNYVHKILESWHTKGYRTVEQVRAERAKTTYKTEQNGSTDRKSSFDIDDLSGLSMFDD